MLADLKNLKRMQMKNGSALPGFVWLVLGLIAGVFLVLMFNEKQDAPISTQQIATTVKQKIEDIKPDIKIKESPEDSGDGLQFDFYKILPELEVTIPDSEIRKLAPRERKPAPEEEALDSGKQYLLQVGSFKNFADADRRKASLALLGIQSSIQNVTIANDQWYRVRVGPISNSSEFRQMQEQLRQNGIQAMPFEVKD